MLPYIDCVPQFLNQHNSLVNNRIFIQDSTSSKLFFPYILFYGSLCSVCDSLPQPTLNTNGQWLIFIQYVSARPTRNANYPLNSYLYSSVQICTLNYYIFQMALYSNTPDCWKTGSFCNSVMLVAQKLHTSALQVVFLSRWPSF